MNLNTLPVILFSCLLLAGLTSAAEITTLIEQKKYPEAELLLREEVRQNPNNQAYLFKLAKVLAWQNRHKEAISIYDKLLARFPTNTDYLVAKAQSLHWSGDTMQAVPILDSARQLNPDYLLTWQLSIRYLARLNTNESNMAANALITTARDRFPAQSWPNTINPVEDNPQHEIETGITFDQLSNQLDDWHSHYLSINRKRADTIVLARIEKTERFSLVDNELTLGMNYKINSKWHTSLEASHSDKHNIKPGYAAYFLLGYDFPSGMNLSASWKKSRYDLADTYLYNLIAEKYFYNFRLAWTGYASRISSGDFDSNYYYANRLSVDYFYTDHNKIGLDISHGRETEYSALSSIVVSNIDNLTLKGTHWLNNVCALNYNLHYQKQDKLYTREGIMLGVRYRY